MVSFLRLATVAFLGVDVAASVAGLDMKNTAFRDRDSTSRFSVSKPKYKTVFARKPFRRWHSQRSCDLIWIYCFHILSTSSGLKRTRCVLHSFDRRLGKWNKSIWRLLYRPWFDPISSFAVDDGSSSINECTVVTFGRFVAFFSQKEANQSSIVDYLDLKVRKSLWEALSWNRLKMTQISPSTHVCICFCVLFPSSC